LDFVISNMGTAMNWLSSSFGNAVLIIVGVLWIVFVIWFKGRKTMIVRQSYSNTVVPLDGHFYKDCTFHNVTFEWNGKGPGGLIGIHITGSHRFQTQNGVIGDAVDVLKGL